MNLDGVLVRKAKLTGATVPEGVESGETGVIILITTVPAEHWAILTVTVKDIEERRLGRIRGGGCKNEKAGETV